MVRSIFIFLLIGSTLPLRAQEPAPADSLRKKPSGGLYNRILYYLEHTHEEKKKRPFDVSFIGGPVYTPETSAGIAVMAAARYSTDRKDSLLPVSSAAIYASGSLTGFYGIGLNSTTIFPRDRFRLAVKASFSSRPNKYWGIGYDAGSNKDGYTEFVQVTEKIQADISYRLAPRLFAGVSTFLQNVKANNIDTAGGGKPYPIPEQRAGFGAGPFVVFDSRDFIPNAYKGIYVRLGYKYFPSFLGNKTQFSRFDLQFDWYRQLWQGAVLATDLYAEEHSGDVPWSFLAEAGGNRLRGYYEGRFRDKNFVAVQAELRQKIYRRSGAVVWIGAGNVAPSFREWTLRQSLISYGIGYRWEFKKRINIRLDYGRGKDQNGFYFGINEVF
ncbi:BamA/TamA family outer membrane protein [Chitinophaga nivalis]|uniref:BamA/TamA family outer membrane protein n=1 Tax=Chitinophaga nivalis TaxID=2991709 RepID=A0ABT3IPJ7_9BACT|nr:BamA/TamA family outer membrane protein [Chitinophaga nivalis]MCW3464599.1 BamA/TamA family outer membrane protein [Chitinophaga nivalis]MCW3485710.1 BamA/TamA family outer membrane protein [Chitinophaga nivalis]